VADISESVNNESHQRRNGGVSAKAAKKYRRK
jgi:hypothetical protein